MPGTKITTVDIAKAIQSAFSNDKYMREDLEMALEARELSQEAKNEIRNNATETTFHPIIGAEESFETDLANSFQDPAINSLLMLQTSEKDSTLALHVLEKTKRALEDAAHNFPRILKEEMPGSVNNTIQQINEKILPDMSELINALEEKTGLKASDIETATDWQHVHRLPENLEL